jgi:hypothetical protein
MNGASGGNYLMSSKTRLANKTIWALEDITAICMEARGTWRQGMTRAEKTMDGVMMASLAILRDQLAEIERIARNARQGEYEERIKPA